MVLCALVELLTSFLVFSWMTVWELLKALLLMLLRILINTHIINRFVHIDRPRRAQSPLLHQRINLLLLLEPFRNVLEYFFPLLGRFRHHRRGCEGPVLE